MDCPRSRLERQAGCAAPGNAARDCEEIMTVDIARICASRGGERDYGAPPKLEAAPERVPPLSFGSTSMDGRLPQISQRDWDLADQAIRRSGVIIGAAFYAPREFSLACALARRQGWEAAIQRCI